MYMYIDEVFAALEIHEITIILQIIRFFLVVVKNVTTADFFSPL